MPRHAIHPGEHLAEQLEALKMSAARLARQLKVPTNRITHIFNGQRAITGDTALRLGQLRYQCRVLAELAKTLRAPRGRASSRRRYKGLPRLRDRAA
jgi:addiction module HigA family antidote